MDTGSFQFIAFGLAVAFLSNCRSSRAWRSWVLLSASLVFLVLLVGAPNLRGAIPLLGFLFLGYTIILSNERGWPKALIAQIVVVIAAYVWLKKYTFLPESAFLHFPYFTLGLSYIFFRVLHLVIDSGEGGEQGHIGLHAYLAYMLNFTTLVSGPIQRYDEFARDQFVLEPIPLTATVVGTQLERIVRGFFKVNVLAMIFHALQQDALTQLSQPLPLNVKLFSAFRLIVVYPLFLYANFSGYIDIVIAICRLLRVRLPENFDRPFSASSFLEFWSRWHITLSAWLKTYVYNPLLMFLMRRIASSALQPLLGVLSFFVTFFLVGIWHGRTSEFLIFGVLQGGGVSLNKLWQLGLTRALGRKSYKRLSQDSAYIAFGRGLTFTWFAFTLCWFWADWKQIAVVFTAVGVVPWLSIWLAVWLSATAILALWEWLRAALLSIKTAQGPLLTSRYALVAYASLLGLASIVVTVVLAQPAPDVVYKAF